MTWKGWETYTPVVQDRRGDIYVADPIHKKKSKYGAQPTEVDGIRFASKKEAARYGELKLLEQAGEIHGFSRQVSFPLVVTPEVPERGRQMVGAYVADFTYCPKGSAALIVEDAKGVRTPLYKWKKRHMFAQYGIEIREV